MPEPIIVTATDSTLFWLAKGLVLSTVERRRREGLRMVCLDLGLASGQADWLASQGVEVAPAPDPAGASRHEGFQPYMLGQLCRPYLPDLLPGHGTYIWLDADTWVTGKAGLDGLLHVARFGLVACSPEVHPAYNCCARNAPPTQRYWRRAWTEVYGPEAADRLAAIPMLNSGVLAVPAGHDLWGRWQAELRSAMARPLTHLSEQLAFFRAASDLAGVERLPAHWNWLANFSPPRWHGSANRWIEPSFPHAPIHILHLAGAALRQTYHRLGFLHDRGAYLGPGDLPPQVAATTAQA